ncbi:imidazole glycerol phosphate synthase subunit HisH [Prochlorococcus marinus]|uniref:imidazole glycerol phosphate synthase subunit HisH n=1 Tax=Prochlorococcus marinus TaxID=1219 RepID=UPI0022B337DB|nr:imidazole glycerol phosphate synthase subunit HisH [Prochlorococcus marinus]
MVINIGLIDYGMGNLHSVERSFNRLGQNITIVKDPSDIKLCNALILPGVGSFRPAMRNLEDTKLIPEIQSWVLNDKPLLGICLGLQLLFEFSEEGNAQGLGLIKGKVSNLPTNQNQHIPHIGWALLNQSKHCPLFTKNNDPQWMYFVHSFAVMPSNKKDIAATIDFGSTQVTAIIWRNKLAACQFHPEKSGKSGELLLKQWLSWLKTDLNN